MSAAIYTLDPDFMKQPPVLRIAVLVQLRALAAPVVRELQDGPLSCRDLMAKLGIADDDVNAMADLIVTLLQLQAFGLVTKHVPVERGPLP